MDIFSGESILSQVPDVNHWLASHGLNSTTSRYSRYIYYIDAFFESKDPTSSDGRDKFDLLTKSYAEIIEIVSVKKAFEHERSPGFIERLSKVVSGVDHVGIKEPSEPRNFLYELLMAARLKNAGFIIDFDQGTDVVAYGFGRAIFVECKRTTSIRGFESNFIKGGKQLERKFKSTKLPHFMIRGFIAIDVLPYVLNDIPKFEIDNEMEARICARIVMERFKQDASRHINKYISRYENVSAGVVIMAMIPVWLRDVILLHVNEIAHVIPPSTNTEDVGEVIFLAEKLSYPLLPDF